MSEFLDLRFRTTIESQSAKFVTLQRLGFGGAAETYLVLATHGQLQGQLVALKMFRRQSQPRWRDDFLEEVKFLRTCSHPSVMRVFDEGQYLGRHPFVVAEYLPDTLGAALRRSPSMMAKLGYAVQLLSALEFLAGKGVVHRDIKPANVFIKGGSGVLGDFGLMKHLAGGAPTRQRRTKSPSAGPRMPRNHRTPDLVEYYHGGPPPTVKSDVYQLGLLFAEMFSGRNPQKPMKRDFAERIEIAPFKIPGGLGQPIWDLIDSMLRENSEERPSAATLLESWQGIFLEGAKRSLALEGRVV